MKGKNEIEISNIYVTGLATAISNIDLYFQEYFSNIKCEILKPYFIPENVKINIKDYIEVNSAIALAMTPPLPSPPNIRTFFAIILNS